ncbi:MAG: CPBP family intramembrane glutamic endopeptidase [Nostoc sp. CmiVER01]|uniref:CPBP family intramembrane glutamic endopeptidase n=1 Tax=Nostoc sp. CmiVER01 TaxID=3075384 RepID=UPI003D160CDD
MTANTTLKIMRNSKNIRLIEFLIVIAVAFGSAIFGSVCVQLTGAELYYNEYAKYPMIYWGTTIVRQLAIIALVIYLIIRQGRNIKELGFSWLWKDLIISIVLAFMAYIAGIVWWLILSQGYYMIIGTKLNIHPNNIEFLKKGINFWSVTAMLINPFYEELIIRCYTIFEVKFLTNSVGLAVFISVIIQSTYHLYQGFVPALLLSAMFAVFSLYYIKWQRIMPVILAHMYFDLIALFSAASR